MKRSPLPSRWLPAAAVATALATLCLTAASQETPPGANVASLLDYARTHNPEYAAMAALRIIGDAPLFAEVSSL